MNFENQNQPDTPIGGNSDTGSKKLSRYEENRQAASYFYDQLDENGERMFFLIPMENKRPFEPFKPEPGKTIIQRDVRTYKLGQKILWALRAESVWCIDFDVDRNDWNAESQKMLDAFLKTRGYVYYRTHGGGYHFLFYGNGEGNATPGFPPGVDKRHGGGAYFILHKNIFGEGKVAIKDIPRQDIRDVIPDYGTSKGIATQFNEKVSNRNNRLYRSCRLAWTTYPEDIANREFLINSARELALKEGLQDREISATIFSAEKGYRSEVLEREESREKIMKLVTYKADQDRSLEKRVELIDGLVIIKESFVLGGPHKSGKSRGFSLLCAIAQRNYLEANKGKSFNVAVISFENSEETLIPIFKGIGKRIDGSRIEILNPEVIENFESTLEPDSNGGDPSDKQIFVINEILRRLKLVIEHHDLKLLFIDPHTRAIDMNNATLANAYIGGLDKLSKETGCTIGGTINNNKKIEYGIAEKISGSHAILARARVILIAVPIHPQSFLGKRYIGETNKRLEESGVRERIQDALYISSHYVNSLFKEPKAYIITIRSEKISVPVYVDNPSNSELEDLDVGVPYLESSIDNRDQLDALEFFSKRESGGDLRNLILNFFKEKGNNIATAEQVYYSLPFFSDAHIENMVEEMANDGVLFKKEQTDSSGNVKIGPTLYSMNKKFVSDNQGESGGEYAKKNKKLTSSNALF